MYNDRGRFPTNNVSNCVHFLGWYVSANISGALGENGSLFVKKVNP